MSRDLQISAISTIRDQCIRVNDAVLYEGSGGEEFSIFAKAAYKKMNLQYPKFFKMDQLSKLGMLGLEALLSASGSLDEYPKDKIGLFLWNRHSSLHTDELYFDTVQQPDAIASPALFVYTLPNILIGEMCIKHKITGEHGFFIGNSTDSSFLQPYIQYLFEENLIEVAILGHVEFYGNNQSVTLARIEPVSRGAGNSIFSIETLDQIFK